MSPELALLRQEMTSTEASLTNPDFAYPHNVRIVPVQCTGNVSARLIQKTFQLGADGIIVLGCFEDKCHYETGSKAASIRVNLLKKILEYGGIDPSRLEKETAYCESANRFVETANTPLYHKHLPKKEIIQICKHLVEKNGIRSIEPITGHHRDTISRLLEDLALHAEMMNDILLQEINIGQFEVDEMWSFIKKNRRTLSKEAQKQLSKVMHGSTPA